MWTTPEPEVSQEPGITPDPETDDCTEITTTAIAFIAVSSVLFLAMFVLAAIYYRKWHRRNFITKRPLPPVPQQKLESPEPVLDLQESFSRKYESIRYETAEQPSITPYIPRDNLEHPNNSSNMTRDNMGGIVDGCQIDRSRDEMEETFDGSRMPKHEAPALPSFAPNSIIIPVYVNINNECESDAVSETVNKNAGNSYEVPHVDNSLQGTDEEYLNNYLHGIADNDDAYLEMNVTKRINNTCAEYLDTELANDAESKDSIYMNSSISGSNIEPTDEDNGKVRHVEITNTSNKELGQTFVVKEKSASEQTANLNSVENGKDQLLPTRKGTYTINSSESDSKSVLEQESTCEKLEPKNSRLEPETVPLLPGTKTGNPKRVKPTQPRSPKTKKAGRPRK